MSRRQPENKTHYSRTSMYKYPRCELFHSFTFFTCHYSENRLPGLLTRPWHSKRAEETILDIYSQEGNYVKATAATSGRERVGPISYGSIQQVILPSFNTTNVKAATGTQTHYSRTSMYKYPRCELFHSFAFYTCHNSENRLPGLLARPRHSKRAEEAILDIYSQEGN